MNTIIENFRHRHAAHCESGVASSMLSHHGAAISEAMAFGLSSAMAFAYLPFVKFAGFPLIAYRMPPKYILKGMIKPFKMRFHFETFRDPATGMQRLDERLAQGRIVGIQTSAFWLPYFPEEMRFHFNAHNLIVYGKEGDDYLISDPVAEDPQRCASDALQRARFATGLMAPKGLLYYPESIGQTVVTAEAIRRAIKKTVRIMLGPVPIVGVRGMRMLANRVAKLDTADKLSLNYAGHIVRMQEEIGTGGGGFRFLYAAFLQEAAEITGIAELSVLSERMNEIGDGWREFALKAARMIKGREPFEPKQLAELLHGQAEREKEFFIALKRTVA
ncbi:MAG: BtrH N-terminal domain-containing protein [Gammaproteobacteria bacterium]|nr:BtrH N-terminal domain-containing protein [Gammaproteobacteria bacterium]MBU1481602.1 BtrH N-terminal domain-containing protein [Gammaproteobacteria bacterium]